MATLGSLIRSLAVSVVILTNTSIEGLFGRLPIDVRDAIYGRD